MLAWEHLRGNDFPEAHRTSCHAILKACLTVPYNCHRALW